MKFSRIVPAILALVPISQSCLLPHESVVDGIMPVRRQTTNTGIAIGTGDRFQNGTVAPRGLGTQPAGTDLGTLLSVKEVESAFKGLARVYNLDTFETPFKTFENATIFGGKIGGRFNGQCDNSFRVFLNAAIHARERGSSDNLLYFLGDLLYAYKKKVGLTYGGRTFTFEDVRKAYSVGIVFLPLSNPDGVAWDQATHSCWRKNRNPASAIPGNPNSIGIDLNRNFDFLWDFPKLFTPTVAPNVASNNPAAQTFHGLGPQSEPETKSIVWVMDKFNALRWFMDIHSFAGVVLYNWGSADGLKYSEYVPSNDWRDKVYAAMRMGNAMDASTGRHYEVEQSAYLYPTSGASDDYAYSRHFVDESKSKIHGFTVEFGFGNDEASCAFYPTAAQYHQNMLETSAGFMEFLLSAEMIGLGDRGSCPGF